MSMIKTTLASVLALLLVNGCRRDQSESAEGDTAQTRPRARAEGTPAPYTEPQAVQILLAIDQARLANAEALRAKSENEAVLEYTRVVVTDHRAMSVLLDSLLKATGETPADHVTSQQTLSAAQQFAMDILQRDTGINNAYLAQEISDHERALQLLQGAVIPSVRSAQIKSTIEQLVPAYHAHLQQAREILAARRAAAPRAAPAPSQPPPATTTTTTTTTTTSM